MAEKTVWEKTKDGSKAGFDKIWQSLDKLGAPVNKLSNKLGSEAFWPTTLDKESDKAARILRSFCKDGFYAEDEVPSADGPKLKQRVIKKIPQKVVEKAVGLCIFTTMRTGLWMSGSGGSGVLVARQEDGSWSPPSGILLHTIGVGFMAGIDIYDCVIVINNRKALAGFTNIRCTLGGELSAVAGPVGMGATVDSEIHRRQAPLFTYMKSRGFYAGVALDGTIMIERTDENERFYGEKISAGNIISGKVRHPPFEVRKLQETLKAAEGKNADDTLIPDEAPPGDYEIEGSEHVFGVPDTEDPDPYGFHALQEQGMEIKEAGTQEKPPEEEFEFRPSIKSPVIQDEHFQKSIETARIRRGTINSLTSPKLGSISGSPRASQDLTGSPSVDMPRGAPPALPSRDAVAKVETSGDISELKPDAEHFEHTGATADEAATTTGAPENGLKIELRDEEATEVDLAEEKLEKLHVADPLEAVAIAAEDHEENSKANVPGAF